MDDQQTSVDTCLWMELSNLVLALTSPTHFAATKCNINIMWLNSQHKIVFTYSLLNWDISVNNRVPTSLVPKFLQEFIILIDWRWRLPNRKARNSYLLLARKVAFREWCMEGINFSPRSCYQMMQPIPWNTNVLCEDQSSQMIAHREDLHTYAIPWSRGEIEHVQVTKVFIWRWTN